MVRPRPAYFPFGFQLLTIRGERAIQCQSCKRAWRADRLVDQANVDYLREHAQDHKAMIRKQATHVHILEDPA